MPALIFSLKVASSCFFFCRLHPLISILWSNKILLHLYLKAAINDPVVLSTCPLPHTFTFHCSHINERGTIVQVPLTSWGGVCLGNVTVYFIARLLLLSQGSQNRANSRQVCLFYRGWTCNHAQRKEGWNGSYILELFIHSFTKHFFLYSNSCITESNLEVSVLYKDTLACRIEPTTFQLAGGLLSSTSWKSMYWQILTNPYQMMSSLIRLINIFPDRKLMSKKAQEAKGDSERSDDLIQQRHAFRNDIVFDLMLLEWVCWIWIFVYFAV